MKLEIRGNRITPTVILLLPLYLRSDSEAESSSGSLSHDRRVKLLTLELLLFFRFDGFQALKYPDYLGIY